MIAMASVAVRRFEVTVIKAALSSPRSVLARVFVDGDVFGTTSKRRRLRDPVWDRTFGRSIVGEQAGLKVRIVLAERISSGQPKDVAAERVGGVGAARALCFFVRPRVACGAHAPAASVPPVGSSWTRGR